MWLLLSTALHAQQAGEKKSSFFAHVGPSGYTGRFLGITNQADTYRSDLRKGVAWDFGYLGQVAGRQWKLGVGALYQGNAYTHTHDTGGDKLRIHYLAPQLALSLVQPRYLLQLAGGIGYQWYHDRSTVYDRPRKVSMGKLAGNLALTGEYFLTGHWGASARLNWLASSSGSYLVEYHNETWQVWNPKSGTGYFGQLSLLFGINYHF